MKKSLFILFFIKENAPKKNGLCTVLVRLTIEKEYLNFSTKLDVDPKCWNKDTGRVKVKKQEISKQNVYLDDLHRLITEKYDKLFDKGGIITPQQLKDAVFNIEVKEDPNTLVSMFTKHNDDLKKLIGREVVKATYTRYVKVFDRLKQFLKDAKKVDDIPITDVNQMFIRDFEVYLKSNLKCTDNLTAKSLRQLKKIVSIAIDNGIVTGNPFANIKLRFTYEERSYLIQSEIDALINKDFGMKRLEQVRDMFIFSCFSGLAFVDVSELKEEHIVTDEHGNKWIHKGRVKTDVVADVPLSKIPLAILDKYKDDDRCRIKGVLLPVDVNQRMNSYLKETADQLEKRSKRT